MKVYAYTDDPEINMVIYITMIAIQLSSCVIGYVGNIITFVVIASNKSMQTTTNVYLLNLAVADIMMLTAGIILYLTPENQILYTKPACLIKPWTTQTTIIVSAMITVAFTVERYLAICHPFLSRRILSISRAVKVVFVIWIIGLVFGYMYGSQSVSMNLGGVRGPERVCIHKATFPNIEEVESILFFAVPFVVLTVLYILMGKELARNSRERTKKGFNRNVEGSAELQSNKKIFKMLLAIVAVFFISWAPSHVGRILSYQIIINTDPFSTRSAVLKFLLTASGIVAPIAYFIPPAVNPIIYSAMSTKFRKAFKGLLIKCCGCLCKKEANRNEISATTETTV